MGIAVSVENGLQRRAGYWTIILPTAVIFLSEHVKFIRLVDIGSCHWRHRVFSRGYVTGRPLQNSGHNVPRVQSLQKVNGCKYPPIGRMEILSMAGLCL